MEYHPVVAGSAPLSAPQRWWRDPRSAAVRTFSPDSGYVLSPEQIKSFDENGFLLLKAKDVWTPEELKLMIASVNVMGDWKDEAGKWMKYYEPNKKDPSAGKLLCRIENFTQYNPGLDFLLNGKKILDMSSDLLNSPAILYKEKVNYKLPGGDGFAPHQDVAAGWWMYGQTIHLSCLISIDPATAENGCLEVVRGKHLEGMMSEDWKEIPLEKVKEMKWESMPTEPGDVMFFDSYVPHRSEPNNTDKPRRVLYSTYAKACEGDFRSKYYADKRLSFPPDIERDPSKKYEYKI